MDDLKNSLLAKNLIGGQLWATVENHYSLFDSKELKLQGNAPYQVTVLDNSHVHSYTHLSKWTENYGYFLNIKAFSIM